MMKIWGLVLMDFVLYRIIDGSHVITCYTLISLNCKTLQVR